MPDPLDALAWGPNPAPIAPDADFAARLAARVDAIEDRINRVARGDEATSTNVSNPVIIPYLTVVDSRAAFDFYAEVFGAISEDVVEMDDGRIGHMTLHIGDGVIYMADEFPEMNILSPTARGGGTAAVVIQVDDADAVYDHAIRAGATAERPVANQHGGRSGWIQDAWGHRWSISGPEKPGT